MSTLTAKQLLILQKGLSLNKYAQGKVDNKLFSPTDEDMSDCLEMEKLGLLDRFAESGNISFLITTKGKLTVFTKSTKQPRKIRSKKRYSAYLNSGSRESFFEWLKNPNWDEFRRDKGC